MDMTEMKQRQKELRNLLTTEKSKKDAALAEARTSGKGLTGKLLESYERADGNLRGFEIELDAIEADLNAARSGATVVGSNGASRSWSTSPVSAASQEARFNRPLPRGANFTDLVGGASNDVAQLDAYLRAVAMNDKIAIDNFRSQTVGTDSEGGYTAPQVLSAQLWDQARNKTVAAQAGVNFMALDGPGQSFTLPKIVKSAKPSWRTEKGAFSEDSIEFDVVQFVPKSLGLIVKASWELLQDSSQDIAGVITNTVAKEFAQEIDSVIFNGDAADPLVPTGARNFPGVTTTAGAGAPTWSTLSNGALSIREANYEPSSFVMSPANAHALAEQREDGATGPYLMPPSTVSNIPRLATNAFDNDNILTGDFSQMLAGVRLELNVRPLTERYAETGQTGWVFFYRMDTTLMRPEAIHSIEGVA